MIMYPKVKIVVSRTHWQCLSCRFVSKHAFTIEQHLQTQHINLLSPMAASSTLPSFKSDYGSYSDGELDVVHAFGMLKQRNVLKESSTEANVVNSPEFQHKIKTRERSNIRRKEKKKNAASKKNHSKNIENQPDSARRDSPTRHSDDHRQVSLPLQTRRTTRAISKHVTQLESRHAQHSCSDTKTKEDIIKQKEKLQPEEIQTPPKINEGPVSSSSSDFENDSDYEPLKSSGKRCRKRKPACRKSGTLGEGLPGEEPHKTKIEKGQSGKLPDGDLNNMQENSGRLTKRAKEESNVGKRRQRAKSCKSFKDNCEGQGKRPGLGGKPVKRTLKMSEKEKAKLKDCYVGVEEDERNGADITVCSIQVSPYAPLPSCDETSVQAALKEQTTNAYVCSDSISANSTEIPASLHVERVEQTSHTIKHVPDPLNKNKNETEPLTTSETRAASQSSYKDCSEHSTSNENRSMVSSEALVKTADRLDTFTSESTGDVLFVDHKTASESMSHATEVKVTGNQEPELNHVSHSESHQRNSSQPQFTQPGINLGDLSLHPDFVPSETSLGYIKGCQYLSTFSSVLHVSALPQQAHSSVSAEHAHQYSGDTDVFHNGSSYLAGSTLHTQAGTSNDQIALTEKTPLPNETHDTAESGEWVKSRTNFHFNNLKPSMAASIKQPSQIFECSVCQAKFSSADNLSRHVSKMSTHALSRCKGCGKTFHNVYDLSLHVFGEHERKKKPFCFECGENLQTMEAFEHHLHHHLWDQDLKLFDMQYHACRICQEDVLCKYAIMRKHYHNKHKMATCLECLVCSNLVLLSDTSSAKEHRQTHIHFCNICIQDLPTTEALEAHHLHHKNTPYAAEEDGAGDVCERCQQWCPNKASVMLHQHEHKLQVMRDWRVEKWGVNMACPHCDKVLRNKRNLQRHIDQQHATGGRSYKFHCEFCGKGLDSKSALKDHIALRHLGIKRYVCEFCHQRFTNTPTLRRHVLRDHATDKQYICEFCGKRFCEKFNMKKHMYIHTGASRFMCEQCGKAFHSSSEFKKHMSVHVEKRDYVCQGCWQCYKRKEHLKRHISKCPKAVQSGIAQVSSPFLLSV